MNADRENVVLSCAILIEDLYSDRKGWLSFNRGQRHAIAIIMAGQVSLRNDVAMKLRQRRAERQENRRERHESKLLDARHLANDLRGAG